MALPITPKRFCDVRDCGVRPAKAVTLTDAEGKPHIFHVCADDGAELEFADNYSIGTNDDGSPTIDMPDF